MNPMDKYNQLMNGIKNPGALDKGLSFGPHGGMFGSVAPSQDINPERDNPNGYTGVYDRNTGEGFHGSTAHFNTEGLPQMNAQSTFNPEWGVDQNPETGNFGLPSSPYKTAADVPSATDQAGDYTEDSIPWNRGDGDGNTSNGNGNDGNTGSKQSTPFLDAYMRAREASKATGAVTSTMKKYIEE